MIERLESDLRFRWFVGIRVDDATWDDSTFSKNRNCLLEGDIAAKFMQAVLDQPQVERLLSTDHFSVDGKLIEAWASMKSFRLLISTVNRPRISIENCGNQHHPAEERAKLISDADAAEVIMASARSAPKRPDI